MKGFMHIMEILIIVLVMFFVIMQLMGVPRYAIDWSQIELITHGNDVLFLLDKKGVNWFNGTEIDNELKKIFDETNIIYDLKIRDGIKPNITVGCICKEYQESILKGMLNPFTINGQETNFVYIERIDPSKPSFPVRFDVIVIFDANIATLDSEVSNYLMHDRGVVQIRDITNPLEVSKGTTYDKYFGMMWNNSHTGADNVNNITFTYQARDPTNRYYNLYKYFSHIPNSTGHRYPGGHFFVNFLKTGTDPEKLTVNDNVIGRIILEQKNTETPAAIVNDRIVNGAGRTAWISAPPGDEYTDDYSVMVRAFVVWAAGGTYSIITNHIPTNPAVFSMYKTINNDMFQIIEIVLTMGYLYEG